MRGTKSSLDPINLIAPQGRSGQVGHKSALPMRNKKGNDYLNVYTAGMPIQNAYGVSTSRTHLKHDQNVSKKLILTHRLSDLKDASVSEAMQVLENSSLSNIAGHSSPAPQEEGVPVLKIGLNDPKNKSVVLSQSNYYQE